MNLIPALLANWRLCLEGLLVVAILVQTARYEFMEMAFEEFRIETEVAGRVAEAQAKARIAEEQSKKERADAENLRATNRLRADVARLRESRPSSGLLPTAPACPASPEGAERYRAEYQRAYRELVDGLRAEADRGSQAVTDLNTAKEWAASDAP